MLHCYRDLYLYISPYTTTTTRSEAMLSEVSLYVATSEQVIASRKRTAAAWGRGLTLEEYLDRDLVGEGEEFGKDGKLITW